MGQEDLDPMALSVQFDSQHDVTELPAISIVLHVLFTSDETFLFAKHCLGNVHDHVESVKFKKDEHSVNHQH